MLNKEVVILDGVGDIENLTKDVLSEVANTGRAVLGMDTETTGLDPFTSEVRLIQLLFNDKVYVADCFKFSKKQIGILKPIVEHPSINHIFQNAVFDLKMLKYHFDWNLTTIFDTMIAAKVVTNGKNEYKNKFGLDNLCKIWLGVDLDKTEQKSDWSGNLTDDQIIYAARDVMVLLPLAKVLSEEIVRANLQRVASIEFKATLATAMLELNGVFIDRYKWDIILNDLAIKQVDVEKQLKHHLRKPDINLNSPKQLSDALIELGFKDLITISEGGSTKISTADPVISPLARKEPIFALLMAHRETSKLLGSYGRKEHKRRKDSVSFFDFIHPMTGRIHPSFLQLLPESGRYSCANPNVQQIPGMDKVPFRECFVGQNGNKIVVADYSQIELRILGELSADPAFIHGFNTGGDFHVATASMMFGVPMESIQYKDQDTNETIKGPNAWMRGASKSINFGLAYGRGPVSLAGQIGCTVEEAKQYISIYFNKYAGVRNWLDRSGYSAARDGYTRTMSGRIRYFEYDRSSRREYGAVTREGKNTPIQGTSADITKIALYRIYMELLDKPKIKLVNTVHDEVVLECPPDLAEEAAHIVKTEMEEAGREFLTKVPCRVDTSIGDSWAEK